MVELSPSRLFRYRSPNTRKRSIRQHPRPDNAHNIFDFSKTSCWHRCLRLNKMPYYNVKDGTQIYYKVWGPEKGPVVVFSHGWPLNADNWEAQMFFLAEHGFRCIAHDRRGHGRSSQPSEGNNMGASFSAATFYEHHIYCFLSVTWC